MTSIKKLFSVLHSARWLLVGSQLFSFFTIFFNITLLATSAWLISRAAEHPDLSALGLAIVGVRFYGISRAIARYIERYLSHNMAFQGLYSLRRWLYSVIEPLSPFLLQKYSSGDILGRIMADIEILQFFYLRVLIPPITAIVITLLFGIYLGQFTLLLTALIVLAFLINGIILPQVALKKREAGAQLLLPQRARVKDALVETMSGMMDIVAYNSQDKVQTTLEEEWEKEGTYKDIIGFGTNMGSTFITAGMQVCMLLGLLIMAPYIANGTYSGIYLAVIAIGIQAYYESLMPMNDVFYHWHESKEAMNRLIHLDKEPLPIRNPQDGVMISKEKAPSLIFHKVTFSYDDKKVFDNLSFAIHGGEKVAIVGPSGSGKSTLFNVLERFYEYEGSIRLGGVELKDMDEGEVRAHIAMVNQNPYIFHASLEDNIRVAEPYATEEALNKAIDKANLRQLVERIGLKRMVGGGGSQLSGGERQRIALARLYLQNHHLWLLDEPLEGLDQITRKEVYSALEKDMAGKTILFITHQLQGLEIMDRILFFENGAIKEEGTYEELMQKEGDFYQYVKLSMENLN